MSSAIQIDQLLAAVAVFLRERVMPTLQGDLAFETRVSVNALELAVRELREWDEVQASHRSRLVELLGAEASVEELEARLCESIRDGTIDPSSAALLRHLRASVVASLEVDQPRYSALRRAALTRDRPPAEVSNDPATGSNT